MKYSVIIPYYDRFSSLLFTLLRFIELYPWRADWEVLIGVDPKSEEESRLKALSVFHSLPVRLIFPPLAINVMNPGPMYNVLAREARGEFLVLTSPECAHVNNVLSGLDVYFNLNSYLYVVCACRSLDQDGLFKRWYQHSVHRPSDYHFCSALRRDTFLNLGGFCEEYAFGVGYDDNDFRDTLILAGVPFLRADELVVDHQHHDKLAANSEERRVLTARNRAIFVRRCKERGMLLREN